jgi:hypothetical protein
MSETKAGNGSQAMAPTSVARPGEMVRQEFGAHELTFSGETTSAAAAATSKALVEARFVMALRRPRDWDDVSVRLLRAIERPGYAGLKGQKSQPGEAWYHKPVGDGVEGFTIRFAEEAMRTMGNIDARPIVVYEDHEKRLVDVMVLDLESNNAFTATVVVPKTIERSYLKDGETALRQRINSKGKPVFTREATEDEITALQNNLVSKTLRNEIMRMVPGDIQAACRKRILEIRLGDAATNPDGVKKEVIDAFALLNVMPVGLKQWLGHELTTATPAELADLRGLYKAINKGETNWHDALSARLADRDEDPPPPPPGDEQKKGLDGLTERLKQQASAPPAPPAPEPPKACEHVTIPQQRIAALKPGQTIACGDCGQEFRGRSREPGEDDGPDPAAVPDAAIGAAPPSAAEKKEPAKKPGQRKLSEA